jgi:hypothetical protein
MITIETYNPQHEANFCESPAYFWVPRYFQWDGGGLTGGG